MTVARSLGTSDSGNGAAVADIAQYLGAQAMLKEYHRCLSSLNKLLTGKSQTVKNIFPLV